MQNRTAPALTFVRFHMASPLICPCKAFLLSRVNRYSYSVSSANLLHSHCSPASRWSRSNWGRQNPTSDSLPAQYHIIYYNLLYTITILSFSTTGLAFNTSTAPMFRSKCPKSRKQSLSVHAGQTTTLLRFCSYVLRERFTAWCNEVTWDFFVVLSSTALDKKFSDL